MRLSRPDENDMTKRRHFEISIDSPFHILSCRATTANISLPAYTTGRVPATPADEFDCGCPGAAIKRRNTPPPNAPTTNASTTSIDSIPAVPIQEVSRLQDLLTFMIRLLACRIPILERHGLCILYEIHHSIRPLSMTKSPHLH
jgi:hypothetical protein